MSAMKDYLKKDDIDNFFHFFNMNLTEFHQLKLLSIFKFTNLNSAIMNFIFILAKSILKHFHLLFSIFSLKSKTHFIIHNLSLENISILLVIHPNQPHYLYFDSFVYCELGQYF